MYGCPAGLGIEPTRNRIVARRVSPWECAHTDALPNSIDFLLGFGLRKLDNRYDVLPHESADRPTAVNTHNNLAIRGQEISRAVEDLAAIFIEASGQSGHRLHIQAVAHRKIDTARFDSLLRIFLRIHGGGHNFHTFIGKLMSFCESGQLLAAIGSPVAAIEENDTIASCKFIRKNDRSATNALDLEIRKRVP